MQPATRVNDLEASMFGRLSDRERARAERLTASLAPRGAAAKAPVASEERKLETEAKAS